MRFFTRGHLRSPVFHFIRIAKLISGSVNVACDLKRRTIKYNCLIFNKAL